jgi:hypothetical protein
MPSRIAYCPTSKTYIDNNVKNNAGYAVNGNGHVSSLTERKHELLDKFVEAYKELEAYRLVYGPSPSLFMSEG